MGWGPQSLGPAVYGGHKLCPGPAGSHVGSRDTGWGRGTASIRDSGAWEAPQVGSPASVRVVLAFWRLGNAAPSPSPVCGAHTTVTFPLLGFQSGYLTEAVLCFTLQRGVRLEDCASRCFRWEKKLFTTRCSCFGVEGGSFFASSISLKPLPESVRWEHSRGVSSLITAISLLSSPLPKSLVFPLMLVSLATNYLCISFQPRWGLRASVLQLVNSCC